MSRHYLTPLLVPESIAVFGASDRPDSVGGRVFANLLESGFADLIAINPKHDVVQGRACLSSIGEVARPIDLAVIATPAPSVPAIIEECGRAGCAGAIVLSAGFGEAGSEGIALQAQAIAAARKYRMRILGPNCLGVIRPSIGMNATFSKGGATDGELALVSQSGALCTAILDWSEARDIGFSSVISLGAAADVGFGELLDFLALDSKTRSILLYVEGVQHARAFMSGLRAAARLKPVVAIKAGRHEAGSRAAVSHTGALVGSDDVFDAALDRAGVVRASTIDELFAATNILSRGCRAPGNRLAIVTNGGGPGVLAADRAVELGVSIAKLSKASITALQKCLPPHWSGANPVDVLGDAGSDRYQAAIEICLKDENVDGVLAMLTPQAMTDPSAIANQVIRAAKNTRGIPVLACWMGDVCVRKAHQAFNHAGIPSYSTPENAVAGFSYLARYQNSQRMLLEVPSPLRDRRPSDISRAREIIKKALAADRDQLNSVESKALLAAFQIPTIEPHLVTSVEAAISVAERIGYPVVMKISSKDLSHKSDIGGVELNLTGHEQLRTAYHELLARVGSLAPDAEIEGVTIEKFWQPTHARELMLGVIDDEAFGPAISFGAGGTTVEVLKDRAVALPPLNAAVIKNMISETRVSRLLEKFRDMPPIDWPSLENALLRISELVCEFPEIKELDINPLIGAPEGVMAVDARVILQAADTETPHSHLAIPPYPNHLVQQTELPSGETIIIRPIRPEDAAIEQNFVKKLSAEAKHFRFMAAIQELTPEMLTRFTQIDYDQEMAFIAIADDEEVGVARYIIAPDGKSCEFAIVVSDARHGQGIGTRLMKALISEAKSKSLEKMEGEILASNHPMISLVDHLGFKTTQTPNDPTILKASLELIPQERY